MPKRALIEHRPYLLGSIVLSIAYFVLRSGSLDDLTISLMKAGSVAMLAVYAWHRASTPDARLLGAVLALSALGDYLVEYSLEQGGAAFFASHLVAIALYLRNRRTGARSSQKMAGIALLILTPLVSWLLTRDLAVTFYSTALGAMAASAWTSRFSRYRVGLGALLFVVSDWLIFANLNFDTGQFGALVWPIYYSGQFLIAVGVIQKIRRN